MDQKIAYYLNDFIKNEEKASNELIEGVQKQIDFTLPSDYIAIMKEFNGGEGEVGENSWLCLFSISELISTNQNYNLLMEQVPNYFLFGKDAADTGYAFNKLSGYIYSFGLMSNFNTDPIEFCAKTFGEFVEYLYNR